MYEIIKNVITAGKYDLEKLLRKIDVYHLEDKLTDDERTELVALARERANAHDSYGAWQDVTDGIVKNISYLQERLNALMGRVAALEKGKPAPPETPETPKDELNSNGTIAWGEYIPPTGAHNAYNKGDKVTYKGKRYISKNDNNVWSPFAYPSYWEEQK